MLGVVLDCKCRPAYRKNNHRIPITGYDAWNGTVYCRLMYTYIHIYIYMYICIYFLRHHFGCFRKDINFGHRFGWILMAFGLDSPRGGSKFLALYIRPLLSSACASILHAKQNIKYVILWLIYSKPCLVSRRERAVFPALRASIFHTYHHGIVRLSKAFFL